MGEKVKNNGKYVKIDRQPGWLYYVDGDGYVCRAKMKHSKKRRK